MDIKRPGLGASIGVILRHRRLRRGGLEVLKQAVREFFLPQFQSLLLPGTRPVAVVSHPLDDALPFAPSLFRRYLSYFTLWLKTLGCLHRIYGNTVLGDIEGMMRDVCLLYRASGRVYRRFQSTTTSRRAAPANPYFVLIALFDPHLHCIPSLHVLTICYNYHQTRKIVGRHDGSRAGPGGRLAVQACAWALQITEAVLLVKQHSLLDIGPSLFLLSRLFPEYDDEEIRRFISRLFTHTPGLPRCTAAQVRAEILGSYEEVLAREAKDANRHPTEILLGYLREKQNLP
jgi:hypothetical protein